jgi:hypothetical protein
MFAQSITRLTCAWLVSYSDDVTSTVLIWVEVGVQMLFDSSPMRPIRMATLIGTLRGAAGCYIKKVRLSLAVSPRRLCGSLSVAATRCSLATHLEAFACTRTLVGRV